MSPMLARYALIGHSFIKALNECRWTPLAPIRKGKATHLIIVPDKAIDAWRLEPGEAEASRIDLDQSTFNRIRRAEPCGEDGVLIDGEMFKLVQADITPPEAGPEEPPTFAAHLVPGTTIMTLSQNLALDILWRNKCAWAYGRGHRWVYANLVEDTQMREWNGKHPVDQNTTEHIAPAGAPVLVTMASRFGDVGIRDRNLVPPSDGYTARLDPSKLTNWRMIP